MIDRTKKRVTMLPNEGIAKSGTPLRDWADVFTAARTIPTDIRQVRR